MIPAWQTLFERLSERASARPAFNVPRLLPPPAAQGRARSFDGTEIHWERHGPDPLMSERTPILFCYGLVCSMSQWRAQVARYAAERPCLVFDYRGHHDSATPRDPRLMNLSALARDARAVLVANKIKKPVHVWGHSLGCNVALELAAADPAVVRSLTLLCGTVTSPFHRMFGTDLMEKIVHPLLGVYAGHETLYGILWHLIMRKPEAVALVARLAGFNADASTAEDIETYAQAVAATSPSTFFPLLIELTRGTTAPILPKIRVPALVVAGGKDHVTPPSEQRDLAERLPDAQYAEVPLGSHNVQLDFGEYVALKAEEFWRSRNLD